MQSPEGFEITPLKLDSVITHVGVRLFRTRVKHIGNVA